MERFSYRPCDRLKSRSDYLACKNGRNRFYSHNVIISFIPNSLGHARLGCSVTKNKGKSFQRNLFKRRLKEAFRQNLQLRELSFDIHIIPQKSTQEYTWNIFSELMDELVVALTSRFLSVEPGRQIQ